MFIVTILNKAKFPCDILYTNKWCNEALAMWKLYHDTTQHPHEQPRGQITCLRSPVNTSPLQPRAVIALTWHAAHFLSCVLQYMYTFLSSLLEKRLTKQSQFNTFLCLLSTCTRVAKGTMQWMGRTGSSVWPMRPHCIWEAGKDVRAGTAFTKGIFRQEKPNQK